MPAPALRVLKWLTLLATLLFLSVDIASTWIGLSWSSGRNPAPVRTPTGPQAAPSYLILTIRSGRFGGGPVSSSSQVADIATARGWSLFTPTSTREWGSTTVPDQVGRRAYLPIWWLTAAGLALTTLFWWVAPRVLPGRCSRCSYDIRAVAGPVCPECGTALPVH